VKAIILAGGKATRGKPFTDYFPKAMIPINGKPLIDSIVHYIQKFDLIDDIIIVSDFKGIGGQIKHYFELKNGKKITFVQDSQSGTAGDLLHLSKLLKNESEFLLWYVDNLCAINIKKMYQTFKKTNSLGCIATRKYRKEETGFAEVKDNIVTKFIEKPTIILPSFECLGIYIISTQILKLIESHKTKKNVNLSYDIFEKLSKKKKISAYDIGKTPWIDVESPTIVDRKKNEIKKILMQM